MITLKKSFELQNYLKTLFDSALTYLAYADNVTTTTQNHLKNKVYKEAVNETVIKPKRQTYPFAVIDVVDFVCSISNDITNLTIAINNAKHSSDGDFDSLVSVNSKKRTLLNRLSQMAAIKPSEQMTTGCANKFNEAGDQVKYLYDIEEVTTIDFDRDVIKAIVSRLRKEVDATSTTIDLIQLNTLVDFETIYEIGDSLEDAVLKFINK